MENGPRTRAAYSVLRSLGREAYYGYGALAASLVVVAASQASDKPVEVMSNAIPRAWAEAYRDVLVATWAERPNHDVNVNVTIQDADDVLVRATVALVIA